MTTTPEDAVTWPHDPGQTTISLLPLDVGFDLRRHGDITTQLPPASRVTCRYLNRYSQERTVVGAPADVARRLRAAGYRVIIGGTP